MKKKLRVRFIVFLLANYESFPEVPTLNKFNTGDTKNEHRCAGEFARRVSIRALWLAAVCNYLIEIRNAFLDLPCLYYFISARIQERLGSLDPNDCMLVERTLFL
jgi:hypothetical protein